MVERRGGSGVATFFADGPFTDGTAVALPDEAVQHARVRRVAAGDTVRLTDGAGTRATGILATLDRRTATVMVQALEVIDAPEPLTLIVPVADRDRMLWLAEKAAELAVSDWRPVLFDRSRSVSPRGEGTGFARKVRARMIGALEQSGGAWLPTLHDACTLDEAVAACAGVANRLLLDGSGHPMPGFAPFHDTAVALGPEGGLTPGEVEILVANGWRAASLGGTTLRFETAGIAAAAIVRASQDR